MTARLPLILALLAGAASAQAADLPSKKMPVAPPSAPPLAYSWTGAYIGAIAGFSAAHVSAVPNVDPASIDLANATLSPVGVLAGVTVGYNYQFQNNVVLGAVADWSWANVRKSGAFDEDDQAGNPWNVKIRSVGTARVRLGYAMDRFLPYVTAGLAWQNSSVFWNYEDEPATYKLASYGWALGVGADYALTDHWVLKGEYLHLGFGAKKNSLITFSDDAKIPGGKLKSAQDLFRVGVSYKF